ncbi:hypothetical protein Tco_0231682 [Tanacetum coccineum]
MQLPTPRHRLRERTSFRAATSTYPAEIALNTPKGVIKGLQNISTVVSEKTTIMYDIMGMLKMTGSLTEGQYNLLNRDRPISSCLAVMEEKESRMATGALSFRVTVIRSQETAVDFRVVHQITKRQYHAGPNLQLVPCKEMLITCGNSHVKTTTPEAAHAMPWRTLKKMMTDKYCPRGEIKKLEFEM